MLKFEMPSRDGDMSAAVIVDLVRFNRKLARDDPGGHALGASKILPLAA
jgi:hypothetical protein